MGSREAIAGAGELAWYPAEVNTSIRPGWFYHEEEDGLVRPLEELAAIYGASVGGNASFLLNLPPSRRGLVHEADAERMSELGSWWRPDGRCEATELRVDLPEEAEIGTVVLQEAIEIGQRVESFSIELLRAGGWEPAYRGTVIGHKKIASFAPARAAALRVRFESCRGFPALAFLGAYAPCPPGRS